MTKGHLNGEGSAGPETASDAARLEDQAASVNSPYKRIKLIDILVAPLTQKNLFDVAFS